MFPAARPRIVKNRLDSFPGPVPLARRACRRLKRDRGWRLRLGNRNFRRAPALPREVNGLPDGGPENIEPNRSTDEGRQEQGEQRYPKGAKHGSTAVVLNPPTLYRTSMRLLHLMAVLSAV